jgi:hypothetical protein
MQCIVPGCTNEATNNFGVRLRRAKTKNAVWAQDTRANICDEHASQGFRITALVELIPTANVETHVCMNGGEDHVRTTPINMEKLPLCAAG